MTEQALLDIIRQGEGLTVEFKKASDDINRDVYESICAFSNREGGHVLLGVKDNGTILGINPARIEKMKAEFVTAINNPQKMYPPLFLTPEVFVIDGKAIIYIYVPKGTQVCRCGGRFWDRNNDSDIDVTNNPNLVYQAFARKQDSYYVNKVFPALGLGDLNASLIHRARMRTKLRREDHPWLEMTDEQLLRNAGLILKDTQTNREGITLAAILLFGTDEIIMSAIPQYKTDAIYRVFDTDRYDDRDMIVTNLLDSYDRLLAFGQKHLNDPFYLEGTLAISVRDVILREIISNLLAHRDFSSGATAKFVIEGDRLFTENSNRPATYGVLDISHFQPYAKNPPISKVFREIAYADELGSGMRNTYKYTKIYTGGVPIFQEGDVFRTIIPLNERAIGKVGPGAAKQLSEEMSEEMSEESRQNRKIKLSKGQQAVLDVLKSSPGLTTKDLAEQLGVAQRTIDRYIVTLKKHSLLEREGSTKHGLWIVKPYN